MENYKYGFRTPTKEVRNARVKKKHTDTTDQH
jgi:hypothetical protein